jgi:hypothetical protein
VWKKGKRGKKISKMRRSGSNTEIMRTKKREINNYEEFMSMIFFI